MAADRSAGRVLVFAPRGRNARLIGTVLGRAGLDVESHPDLRDLCDAFSDATGAAILSEEALGRSSLACLVDALNRQPAWSEIPLVILTGGGTTTRASLAVAEALGPRGNFTLVERPVRILTLVTVVRAALRARRRQYEVRSLLASERAAREEAERASTLKDQFLATLSHELRTPLNAILGWSQILERGRLDAGGVAEGAAVIARNARAQAQLIGDLLDLSRIAAGKISFAPRAVDVRDAVAAAVESVRLSAAAKRLRLDADLGPASAVVSGDPDRLQQVFWNLLVNATKFTPEGGGVRVSVGRAGPDVEVRVSDTGQGISPEFLPHVFDRFRQADGAMTRRHGGLGIGLALVKQLVDLHGGGVRAESEGNGRGATFVVTLPAATAADRGAGTPSGRRAGKPLGGGGGQHGARADLAGVSVLVVDDEPDALSLARRVLEGRGARVFIAGSAADGLAAVRGELPDVLVSDIGMPETDGYALIRSVRALRPDEGGRIPAAALTAFARPEDRDRALAAGFQAHVTKPVEPDEFLTVVAGLAGRVIG